MKIVFVGGGSGGHFYPLIAVAEAIKQDPAGNAAELIYIGSDVHNPSELERVGIQYIYCPAGKVRRYFSIQNILDIFKNIGGILYMWYKMYLIYPDVIFSKGSYASIPTLAVAWFYRIPVVVHESDSKPGRATLFAKRFAKYIAITYPETASYFDQSKTAVTGIPVRQALLHRHTDPFAVLGLPHDLPIIYITGGSLGAERINQLILSSLSELLPYYRIFHQTGPYAEATMIQSAQALIKDPALLSRYYVKGTLPGEAVSALLDVSSLIITRAGSTTLFEIALHNKPSIVIPIPEEVSHDQRTNAYNYARNGAASVMEEGNLTPHLLVAEIQSIMTDPSKYQRMQQGTADFAQPTAAAVIAEKLIEFGITHGS